MTNIDSELEALILGLNIRNGLRLLGYDKDEKKIHITEGQRPHAYIIGSTRQGKSKYLEHLIRGDINRGLGCCLLDPSAGGETAYNILKFCASINHQRVLLIDPYHRFEQKFDYKVPALSPFLYYNGLERSPKLLAYSIGIILDTVRTLFGGRDEFFSNIERYLPSVLSVLYQSQSLLVDAKYFGDPIYKRERNKILMMSEELDVNRRNIENAFADPREYANYHTTINRINKFYNGFFASAFARTTAINWWKMVQERWVILVNLETSAGFDMFDSKLLGTLIMNQIQTAIARINKMYKDKGYDGSPPPYYLYVDEASKYANETLVETMELKQKTGLKVTIGHQSGAQFKDKRLLERILNVSPLRVTFDLPGRTDRDRMAAENYGGAISVNEASYSTQDMPVQYATLKPIKGDTVRIRTPSVAPVSIPQEELDNYIRQIYNHPFYHSVKELEQINKSKDYEPTKERFYPEATQRRTKTDSSSSSTPSVPDDGDIAGAWKPVSQNIPVSKKHARKTGKGKADKT
jgi:hypothetical protein